MPTRVHKYQSLEEEDGLMERAINNFTPYLKRPASRYTTLLWALVLTIAFAATTTAGFFAGRFYSLRSPTSRRMHGSPPPIIELNPVTVTSKSNRTYLERPSPENDKLWEALYPKGHHCLFEWPNENPKRAGFAGFHQLHCVDALRKGFYQDHDVKQALLRGEDISDIPQPIDMVHVLHCVEFLRQSIICHADTSLQLSNPIIREYLPLALRTLAEIGGRW